MPIELVPLSTVSSSQLVLFASALVSYTNETSEERGRRLARIYDLLERRLLRPDLLVRVLTGGQSRYTPLCADHKTLNASPVHSLFLLVKIEVGIRLNSLVQAGRERVGDPIWDRMILNLRSLHGIWLSTDVLKETFGTSLQLETNDYVNLDYYRKWTLEPDGCEACMISRITGDYKTLFDLRTTVLSRFYNHRRKKNNPPQLWTWIEAWTNIAVRKLEQAGYGEMVQKNLKESDLVAAKLHNLRRDLAKARRREKKQKKQMQGGGGDEPLYETEQKSSGGASAEPRTEIKDEARLNLDDPSLAKPQWQPSPDWTEADPEHHEHRVEESAYDAEHEIIDCYAALISTPFRPSMTFEEHQRAERHLSTTVLSKISLVSTVGAVPQGTRGNTNPYRLQQPAEDDGGKGLSAKGTDTANLAKHQSYVAPRSEWKKQPENVVSSSHTETSFNEPSNIFSKNSSTSVWTDITVPPSQFTLPKPGNGHSNAPQTRREFENCSPISEEQASRPSDLRQCQSRRTQHPNQYADYRSRGNHGSTSDRSRRPTHQSVSLISERLSDVEPGFEEQEVSLVVEYESHDGRTVDRVSREPTSQKRRQERRRVAGVSHGSDHELRSKLSRPFSMPACNGPDQSEVVRRERATKTVKSGTGDLALDFVASTNDVDRGLASAREVHSHSKPERLSSCQASAPQGTTTPRSQRQKPASERPIKMASHHKPGVINGHTQASTDRRDTAVSTQTTWTAMYRHLVDPEHGCPSIAPSESIAAYALRKEEEAKRQQHARVVAVVEENNKVGQDRAQALRTLESNARAEGLVGKTIGLLHQGLGKKGKSKKG